MEALTDNLLTKDWLVIEHNSNLLNEGNKWVKDDSFSITCTVDDKIDLYVDDNTIYFETSTRYGKRLGGFYVERVISDPTFVVYSHVSPSINEDDEQLYLYKLGNKWIISDEVGSDNGFAYVVTTLPLRMLYPTVSGCFHMLFPLKMRQKKPNIHG